LFKRKKEATKGRVCGKERVIEEGETFPTGNLLGRSEEKTNKTKGKGGTFHFEKEWGGEGGKRGERF